MKKTILLAALTFVLVAPALAFAHVDGASLEKEVGGYFFDVGYSADFIAGDFIRLDLAVSHSVSRENIPFESAWVRVRSGESTLFAGPISYGEFGKPGFSYVFPRKGEYVLSVRFDMATSSIAEVDFPVTVLPSPEGDREMWLWRWGFAALGAVLGIACGILFKSYA